MFVALLNEALSLDASDVFLASVEDGLEVSLRVVGLIKPLAQASRDQGIHLINFIKTGAQLDIAERRRPQDGRWIYRNPASDRPDAVEDIVDLRVSCLPTLHGEDVALRLLHRDAHRLELQQLGMLHKQLNELQLWINSPGGLILVTGPTGCGKTTTQYACLQALAGTTRKINTIEDPIEYALEGIRQSQVQEKIGLGFPALLKGVLRQGPDVVMIGEVRDEVTADTAVRAANSGHLVFATLHAPTAATAVQSLLNLGVAPHFVATSLLGSLSQRLVRTLDPASRVAIEVPEAAAAFADIRHLLKPDQGFTLYSPGRDPHRPASDGYRGRSGVFELMTVHSDLRQTIANGRPAGEIQQAALEHGMIPLRHAALLKVANGETTVEEILRTIPGEYVGLDD